MHTPRKTTHLTSNLLFLWITNGTLWSDLSFIKITMGAEGITARSFFRLTNVVVIMCTVTYSTGIFVFSGWCVFLLLGRRASGV